MKRSHYKNYGFTIIELLIVMSLLLVVTTSFYRFYHEAYINHGNGVRQDMARLQKARIFMAYFENDFQQLGSGKTEQSANSATVVKMPVAGTDVVSYRLEPNGVITRISTGKTLALLDGVKKISLQPYRHYQGLYRLQISFTENPHVHSTLDMVDRVLGYSSTTGGTVNVMLPRK